MEKIKESAKGWLLAASLALFAASFFGLFTDQLLQAVISLSMMWVSTIVINKIFK
jgi:hypothetical protein